MTRTDVGAAMQGALAAPEIMLLALVELDFAGDPLFVWTGTTDLAWNGNTWSPVGNLGEISPLASSAGGRLENLTLKLSGFPAELLGEATGTSYKGRTGRVWIAAVADDQSLIDEPALFFAGSISAMTLAEQPRDASITVTLEGRDVILRKPAVRFRSDSDHQAREPGDPFFEFVPDVISKTIYWGLSRSRGAGGGNGGGGRLDEEATDFKLR